MDVFEIRGGHGLHGEISIYGAKNAALPVLAATVMVDGTTVIHEVPQLEDVRVMIEILQCLGAKVDFNSEHTISVDARKISNTNVPAALMKRMRSLIYRYLINIFSNF